MKWARGLSGRSRLGCGPSEWVRFPRSPHKGKTMPKIKLSGFQMLLLICWLEVKTGIPFSAYYYIFGVSMYLLFKILWRKAIYASIRIPMHQVSTNL